MPGDQPTEGIDSYGGKGFEKRNVLKTRVSWFKDRFETYCHVSKVPFPAQMILRHYQHHSSHTLLFGLYFQASTCFLGVLSVFWRRGNWKINQPFV